MERHYLLGNEAIAHACLESGIDFASGYPGTPSSEVVDVLRVQKDLTCHVEWSVNEKVALENALAAAWCGLRSICTMKHVGLNVAADPLMTSAYTGVTGGLVIMSADDPFAHSSQNEQDTRCYAHFARLPCLDPSGVQEAHDMIRAAFEISEEFKLPVLFRPTTRICHSKGDVELGAIVPNTRVGEFHKDPRQYVVIPAHTRILHKKLNEKQPALKKRLVERGLNYSEIKGKTAIIASGIGASYVQELLPPGVSFMKIGAYPIDEEWLGEFARNHEKILIIEELAPVVEEAVRQVAGCVPVFGKINGYAPYEGELSPGRCRCYHGKGRVPAGKPVCRPGACTEHSATPAHPLRRLPSPCCVLRDKKGVQGIRHLPKRYRVLHAGITAGRRRYHYMHGRLDHGRERDLPCRRIPRCGLHYRRLYVPAHGYPGTHECGLQWREHDRGHP